MAFSVTTSAVLYEFAPPVYPILSLFTYKPNSEAQAAHRLRWADARRQAFAELNLPPKREYWLKLFNKQKKYVRLDCFVTAQILSSTSQRAK